MKRHNSVICIAIILSLLWIQASPVIAVAAPPRVRIFTVDDLCRLSKDCAFDKWSWGRTVLLEANIDLTGSGFRPIPIFGGVFDGQGHSIVGLSVDVEGSNQGLFRYLQKDGIIRNLSVRGVITPGGDKSNIGGIVGNNSGVLQNCSFSGYVKGKDNVGGLVGWNDTSGTIINSSSSGVIYGKSKVGGVVGFNVGTVLRCSNDSSVNTTVEEYKLNFEELTVDEIGLFKSFMDAMDIGGIAGVNSGIVRSSENRGSIGYPHVGYNVGGIVGRQSGHVTECSNHGSVYGRKEVGGIVGQMEPDISTSIAPSKLKDLQRELGNLQSSLTRLLDDTKTMSNEINEGLSSVQDDINSSRVHGERLINQTEALLNKDIEEINRISAIAIEAMDRLVPVMDAIADTMEIMDKALYPLGQSMHYLAAAMDELSELSGQVKKLSDTIHYSLDKLQESRKSVEKALSDLKQVLELLFRGETNGVLELLRSAKDNLNRARDSMEQAIKSLRTVEDQLMAMITTLGAMGRDLGHALRYLRDAIIVLDEAMDHMPAIFRGISGLLDYLAESSELEFATTDGQYQETKENLFRSIGSMSDSLFNLISSLKREGDVLTDDIQRVSDQLFLVLNVAFDAVEEIGEGEIDPSKILGDISRDDVDGKIEGKVSNSSNFGHIEGDINVGGVAGAMAIEFLLDAEEELSIKNKPTLKTVFKTRAIMRDCENRGVVTGKKSNVGGIVGNMDLGYIKGCVAGGSVESIGGHYVGGVAGTANGLIDSSYSKCALDGGNYVGGIAGFGQEIIHCYSIVSIGRSRACAGAIAGYVDKDSVIRDNYFVSDVLAGIDGISYMGRAEAITYEDLMAIDGLPTLFKEFTLTFLADDVLVDTIEFTYGGSIAEEDIPQVPPKPGHYGRWAGLDMTSLTSSFEVKAEYFPYVSVLESKEKREGPLSVVLVEGQFTDEDSLSVERVIVENESPSADGEYLEKWCVLIPDDGSPTHVIRFMPPAKNRNLAVRLFSDGEWVDTNIKWDGKYMVFESSGNSVTFGLVQGRFSYGKHWTWALLGIAAALGIVALIMRKKKPIVVNDMKGL